MPSFLLIDTSSKRCSVAWAEDSNVTAYEFAEDAAGYLHAEQLHGMLHRVAQGRLPKVDAIVVSSGPGSYTGLRIGVSTAKGLAYALDKPLISLSSLEILAQAAYASGKVAKGDVVWPAMDARRMEVYAASFDSAGSRMTEDAAIVLENEPEMPGSPLWMLGDGADKAVQVWPEAHNLNITYPDAKHMLILAQRAYDAGDFDNVHTMAPQYLKAFRVGRPNFGLPGKKDM